MKLLASDYDGTLKSDIKNLKLNIKAVNEFMTNGNKFAIITGRSFKSIKKEIEKYNIKYDYLSCNNGLIVFDKEDNIISSSCISKDNLKLIKEIVEKSDNIKNIKFYDFYDSTEKIENILEISLEFNNIKSAKKYKKYLENLLTNVSCYQVLNMIFIGNNQKKSQAVEIIKIKENINYEKVYTVGDNLNDLEMLKEYNGYKIITSYPSIWFKNIPTTREVYTLIKKINKR